MHLKNAGSFSGSRAGLRHESEPPPVIGCLTGIFLQIHECRCHFAVCSVGGALELLENVPASVGGRGTGRHREGQQRTADQEHLPDSNTHYDGPPCTEFSLRPFSVASNEHLARWRSKFNPVPKRTKPNCWLPNWRNPVRLAIMPHANQERRMLDRSLRAELEGYRKTLASDDARRLFDERIERLLSQHGIDYVRGYVDALKEAL
jgi:hypothetical protein